MTLKNYDDISAIEALKKANEYAVAPFIFQAIVAMKKLGVFSIFEDCFSKSGFSKEELASKCNVSYYVISVLVDIAVTADIMIKNGEKYSLSKVGAFLSNDHMTNVNLNFSNDVCYEGLSKLTESLVEEKPKGLSVFTSDYDTIYPFLSSLPNNAKKSWFDFDHYYSDCVFTEALQKIFAEKQFKHIYDIGGNTGKFSLEVVKTSPDATVTIIDLPQQCKLAEDNIREKGYSNRIKTFPINILEKNIELPKEADLWWMSQFLDCFSAEQIENILKLVFLSMKNDSILVINEIFGDRQSNDIASLVVDANSLYFTALANGKSRFYHYEEFVKIIKKVGFEIYKEVDNVGLGHTLLFIRKNKVNI